MRRAWLAAVLVLTGCWPFDFDAAVARLDAGTDAGGMDASIDAGSTDAGSCDADVACETFDPPVGGGVRFLTSWTSIGQANTTAVELTNPSRLVVSMFPDDAGTDAHYWLTKDLSPSIDRIWVKVTIELNVAHGEGQFDLAGVTTMVDGLRFGFDANTNEVYLTSNALAGPEVRVALHSPSNAHCYVGEFGLTAGSFSALSVDGLSAGTVTLGALDAGNYGQVVIGPEAYTVTTQDNVSFMALSVSSTAVTCP